MSLQSTPPLAGYPSGRSPITWPLLAEIAPRFVGLYWGGSGTKVSVAMPYRKWVGVVIVADFSSKFNAASPASFGKFSIEYDVLIDIVAHRVPDNLWILLAELDFGQQLLGRRGLRWACSGRTNLESALTGVHPESCR